MRKTAPLIGLVMVALGGCSQDDSSQDDSSQDDSVAGGTVTISTLELERSGAAAGRRRGGCEPSGNPEAGVPIIIHAPDGSNTVEVTDENGELVVDVPTGSAVTAAYAANECGGQQFNTFLAVEAGDHLRFGSPQALIEVGSMTITWPAQDGVEEYEVICSCGSFEPGTATSAVIPFSTDCGVPTAHAMVVGYAGEGGDTPVVWAPLGHFPFEDGATVSVTEFFDPSSQSLDVTGIPSSVSRARVNVSPHIGDNFTVRPFVTTGLSKPVDGRLHGSGGWAPGSDEVFVEGAFDGASYGTQHWHDLAAPAEPLEIESPPLLPWIDASNVTVDMGAREFRWDQTGDGAYDAAVAWMVWFRRNEDGEDAFQWAVLAPAGAASFPIPTLPDDFADLGPGVADNVGGTISLLERSDVERIHEIPLWEAFYGSFIDGEGDYPRVITSGP